MGKYGVFCVVLAALLLLTGCKGLGGTFTWDMTGEDSALFTLSGTAVTREDEGLYLRGNGSIASRRRFGYGSFSVRLQPAGDPSACTVLSISGETDDSISVSFTDGATRQVRLTCTTAEAETTYPLALDFDAAEAVHTYGFLWMMDSLTWYVDGQPVHTLTRNLPKTPGTLSLQVSDGTALCTGIQYIEP